jgi:nucleoside-diphosphate-sugar epimerase
MSGRKHKRIAILGATGHIAKSLIDGFCRAGKYKLFLFARSRDRLGKFLADIQCGNNVSLKLFSEFYHAEYDVIINCVGIGDPGKLKNAGISIFRLTETYDNLVLDYLEAYPEALYINFSSGAAYGTEFSTPVNETTCTRMAINHIAPSDYYGIAKINAEAKHRALDTLNIVDLRVFGFFSRFIDLRNQYFMSEVISCVKYGKGFETGPENITRDFVHPRDLMFLIEKCIAKKTINDVFDVYSLKPATKFEILDYFNRQYGLKYTVKENINISTATGIKNHYYSKNRKAQNIGYYPQFASLESIIQESKAILQKVT